MEPDYIPELNALADSVESAGMGLSAVVAGLRTSR